MQGLSPKLPLTRDAQNGYSLNKTYRSMIQQNVKMLLLTIPGERIMDPLFGVGLKAHLFNQNNAESQSIIEAEIREQILKYMPFVQVVKISFENIDTSENLDNGLLTVRFEYAVPSVGVLDKIDLGFDLSKELIR